MNAVRLTAALLVLLAAASASAQPLPPRSPPPAPPHHHGGKPGFHGGFPIFVIEREPTVIVEREVIREVPAEPPAPAAPSPAPRKPWVLGASYASLPGGCLKLIERGTAYFLCSGEWYRQVGAGSGARYKAVARP